MVDLTVCTPELQRQRVGWKIKVTVLSTWIPVLIVVIARLFIRKRSPSGYGLDDYSMILATALLSCGSAFHLVAVHYGLGSHFACLDARQHVGVIKYQVLAEAMNISSIWIIKVSICFFLLRVLKGVHHKARLFLWTLIVVNSLINTVAMIIWGILKYPIQSWWDPRVKTTFDIVEGGTTYLQVVFIINAVMDFTFAFSPIYFLWNVKIGRRDKRTLWGLLLLAILPSVAAVVKVVYLREANHPADPAYSPAHRDDIAALVEQNGGAFVANLPCLKVFFDHTYKVASKYIGKLGQQIARTHGKKGSLSIELEHAEDNASLEHSSLGGDAGAGSKRVESSLESRHSSLHIDPHMQRDVSPANYIATP